MNIALASSRVEIRRLARSGLLLGLIAVFAFFGLSGPALALYMPEILSAATGNGQLTIEAAAATPQAAIMLYNQSAMQLGLILAIAVAISSLGWDARPGSSVFYRTRVQRLTALMLPRLIVGWSFAVAAYTLGLLLAVALTATMIGPVDLRFGVQVWATSSIYLAMSMSIGYFTMAVIRRTAAAIAMATVLSLILPVLSQLPGAGTWSPTTLLSAPSAPMGMLALPALAALIVIIGCIIAATLTSRHHILRRDA
ncbi:hypothetical protein [Microbacterium murale]|uniref:ABC-2 type transport system permease protein n=1 Tax=Microbacterium murale TaxID=1081040 RepID=A0ABU0PE38_9MICO|nr:hypothetical protein [Microbacterium murale]MDQ0644904.1 ABC-2 type transport system permease protein [Microbacterium murale]